MYDICVAVEKFLVIEVFVMYIRNILPYRVKRSIHIVTEESKEYTLQNYVII